MVRLLLMEKTKMETTTDRGRRVGDQPCVVRRQAGWVCGRSGSGGVDEEKKSVDGCR